MNSSILSTCLHFTRIHNLGVSLPEKEPVPPGILRACLSWENCQINRSLIFLKTQLLKERITVGIVSHFFCKGKSKAAWQAVKRQDQLSSPPFLPAWKKYKDVTHLINEGYSKVCRVGDISKSSYWSVSAFHGIFEDSCGVKRWHKN